MFAREAVSESLHRYGARIARFTLVATGAGILLALAACAGGPPHGAPPAGPPPGHHAPPPDVDVVAPDHYNVTFTTRSGQFFVDDLQLEFNQRRYRLFFGFWPDRFDVMEQVDWAPLVRAEFVGMMPQGLFDQAYLGREDQNLRQDQAFELRLVYRDLTTQTFYAIIPKFRGERDFQVWEQPMTGNPLQIDYIEFDR